MKNSNSGGLKGFFEKTIKNLHLLYAKALLKYLELMHDL